MKTLRDTNNNNSNNATSNETIYHNSNQQNPLISTYNNNDTINPLVYLQLMNANTMFMQQLSSIQNSNDLNNQILTNDSNIFLPKTRPMTQNEIAEHARLIYQRALQRNQLQQHNELMKHFYDMKSISNRTQVPTVPNVTNIGTFDGVDTMITSPSSCVSIKDGSINDIRSSLSLISLDENKMNNSILDPSAPVFIPRQNQQKFDDENETSSSSSDSDFNDFHYLDQFLEEFYHTNNEYDNHLIIQKNSIKVNQNILGQGDTNEQSNEQLLITDNEKHQYQYSIYELLNRYRNPRCHLVLPEWSRLSLILPNVCSMRAHTYKIKRYFAYRRRLIENQDIQISPIQG